MTREQAIALQKIAQAITDTVKECGAAPGGVLYAALMAQGCTLSQFEAIMAGLVRAGLLTVDRSHVYRMALPQPMAAATLQAGPL